MVMSDSGYDEEVMRRVAKMDKEEHETRVETLARVYRELRDDPARLRAIEALLKGRATDAEILGQPAQPTPAAVSDILPVLSTEGRYLGTMHRALVARDDRYVLTSRGNGQEVIMDMQQDKSPADTPPSSGAPVSSTPVSGMSGSLSGAPAPKQYPLYDADNRRKGMCTEEDARRHNYWDIRDAQGEIAAYQEQPPSGWHLRPRRKR